MPKKKEKKKVVYRSSVSGKFAKKKFVEKHPRTTEKEKVGIE